MKEKEKYVDHNGVKFVVTAVKKEFVYYVKQTDPEVEYHCLHEAFLSRFNLLEGE
jgi:hypothetical protein